MASYSSVFYSFQCISHTGIYQWGHELRSSETIVESNLEAFCRRNSPYNGSNIVDRQRELGVNKRLVSFTIDEQIPIWGLECIYRDGEIVGYARCGDYGFTTKKSIGTGLLWCRNGNFTDNKFLKGETYEIELSNRKYPIQLRL